MHMSTYKIWFTRFTDKFESYLAYYREIKVITLLFVQPYDGVVSKLSSTFTIAETDQPEFGRLLLDILKVINIRDNNV